jgi:hypothetical protein
MLVSAWYSSYVNMIIHVLIFVIRKYADASHDMPVIRKCANACIETRHS